MRLSTTLGKLTFVDDTSTQTADPSFKQLLTIEGDELADFSYETFNPEDETTFPGYNSAVKLRTGSLVFTVMEGPLKNIMLFLSNLSRLKAVYDRASEAAMQRAAEVTRMHYDVIIKTPIVVLPQDGLGSQNRLVLRLGQVNAKNSFGRGENSPDSIVASLSGVNITTEGPLGILQILDRVDLSVNVDDYAASSNQPKTQKIHGESNDIHMSLTQQQYVLVMNLTKTLPRILKADDETLPTPARVPHPASSDVTGRDPSPSVAAEGANMDFAFRVPVVRLELYGNKATSKETLHEDSIAAFSINSSHIQYESKADGASEANVTVKSIAMSNTRPGNSIYRDLIPEGKRRGNQFTVQYTVSAQPEGAAQALVTIDSPQVVLAVDPLYALTEFALAPFKSEDSRQVPSSDNDDKPQDESTSKSTNESSLSYRVEVRHSTVLILASDTDPKAQAIEMSIKDVVVAQQAKMTLAVHELGMSFGRMDQPSERVRFLDDVDITVAMDTRGVAGNQSMILDVDITPVIFRASYTEIMLIVDVVNKAAALASAATSKPETAIGEGQDRQVALPINEQSAKPNQSRRKSVTNHPQVVVSKETLHTRIGGFQLVLIGDLQDLPLVHLSTKPFSLNVNDWSTDLHAKTAMSTTINYYNLMNSHWEPLMDPWEFALTVAKTTGTGDNGTMAVKFTSRQRLEMNMTAAFIELAITSATVWSQQHERVQHEGRGVDAPFVVRNRTGYTLLVWADSDKSLRSSGQGKSVQVRRLADNEAIPWRFQDHKRQRENLSSSSHNAFGVQFENMPWERVRNVSVDREGDQSYVLKPRVQEVLHRVVCDVKLKDNVKIVTFRSAFQVENMTHLPMELVLIDANNKQAAPVCKIPPGESYPLPIEAAYNNRFKLRPDRGFDYSWSSDTLSWQDLVRRPVRSIGCKHKSPEEAVFRFQAASLFDKKDPVVKRYPKLNLRLRAPIEVENLLPYNIRYRVYDKNTRSNTTNFLIRGGSSPIHTVQLDHLLLLSVEAQDSGFKQSEFAIINTDNPDDFRTENSLILHDKRDQKLTLRLHYITYPDAGGAMKVQIYSPYIILNKTGLPFSLAFKTWSGVQNKVAGQEAFASRSGGHIGLVKEYD
jgi:vacuolar protein sorting-associated protein 13A/C